ncbi:uncharacterized protein [Populus alba]|uniref:uncharacterized protein n=1 Tax=Populus alba TaxID=43335 RepID=UPI003CC7712C
MENEERSQPEAQYQRELEGVWNDVAHLTSMLEQMLRARDGEGTSTQPNEAPAAAQIPVAPINMGANTPNKQHPNPTRPIQIPITMDLTNEDPRDVKFSNHEGYDKWTALEERLRAIEGNDLFDPIRAAKDSLTGSALSWYMRLDNIRIKKWTDLADAFLKQYKFNLEIAPDRTSLITMEKGTQEAPYYEHLMGSSAQHFYDVVRIAERIEQGIRSGRIAEPIEKRGFIGKKKENELNNLEGRSKNYQTPTTQVTSINFAKPSIPNQPNQTKFPANNQSNYQRRDNRPSEEQLPPLPITLKELYAKLLSIGQIAPLPVPPMQPPFPTWYNPEVTCEYHAGHAGHSIEACFAFKRKVLQLIRVGWVTFEDSPNVNSNPLPKHVASSGGVNTMEIGSKERVLKVTMTKLYFMLLRIEAVNDNEEIEMIENREKCRIQSTANGFSKLVLTKPSYANKVDYGVMPGDYGYTSNIETPLPLFRTEISGLTRSGRCFTPEELEKQRKAKGKEVLDLDKEFEVNKPVTEEETNEFLKLMKHSEYCIVDQLKKTPAKISIMSLILNSEPHRNALQKVMNEAYVPQDIEQKTMEHLVGRIHAANYLYFTEDELDAEGTGHNKPLYVTVRCKDCLIGKVLIDNGSALNVLPRHMLDEMPVDPSHMQPSVMTARAYDGSPRQVIGTIEVELAVGPQVFLVTLQVMDIHPSYSMLLGRPWIHSAGAVTSSLHQCLKYIANGVLVTVKAEETISMVRNVAVPFIEAEDCKDGNLHAFEVVNTEWVPENTVVRKPEISEATKMAAKSFLKHKILFPYDIEKGRLEWMDIIKLKAAEQRFGLGYKPKKEDYKRAAGARREKRMARIEGRKPEEESLAIPPIRISFPKAAYVMQPDKGHGNLLQKFFSMNINTLEENQVKDIAEKIESEKRDEELPQLTIHTLEEVTVKNFVRKLAEGEKNPESGSSTTTPALYIENEWPNFKEYIVAIEDEEWEEKNIWEFTKLIEQHEQAWRPGKEELETINVGNEKIKRELKIGTLITHEEKKELIALLRDYVDVFAWSYEDMPGLDMDIVVHRIPLVEGCKPIKQKLRRTHPEILIKVKAEIEKQWNAGFLEQYLLNPPLLVPPVPERPLILYLTVTETAMGCVLGQHDETGRKERAIYYLSKKFTECESRYTVIEKLCCALTWATKRLRQWQVLLAEYDIVYMTRKVVKGSVIADHLADHAMEDYESLNFDFPDEDVLAIEEEKSDWWVMYFDGAVNVCGNGAGAVIISPNKKQYPVSIKLQFGCTNNTAEYEAKNTLREVHEGICSTHASGQVMARKIQRAGYFWMTLEKDCIDYVRKCHKCQVYSDKINAPPAPLFNLTSLWPFTMWGIDVIGPVNPKASNGHRFILVAIDYFTKWVEAGSFVTQKVLLQQTFPAGPADCIMPVCFCVVPAVILSSR